MSRLRRSTLPLAFAALATAFAVAGAVAAPNRSPLPGCNNPRAIAKYLKLTEVQVAQTKDLREDLRDAVEPLRAQIEPIRDRIRTALDAASPDALAVGTLVVQADGVHDQIRDLQEDFEEDFEALLTADQLAKWQTLQAVCHPDDETTGA
jgi:Spy/CpxP family protein refolding chaperone